MAMPPKLPAVDKVDSMKLIALQTPLWARQPPTPMQLAVLERSRLRQHETAQTLLKKQKTVSVNMREVVCKILLPSNTFSSFYSMDCRKCFFLFVFFHRIVHRSSRPFPHY